MTSRHDLIERLKTKERNTLKDVGEHPHHTVNINLEQLREIIAALSAQPAPVAATFTRYYMRDNHTFKTLSADNSKAIDEIRAEFDEGYTCGMVCGKWSDNKERGEGQAHAHGEWHEFSLQAARWLNAHPHTSPLPQSGPVPRAIDFFNPLTLDEAKARKVCRICQVNDKAYPGNPFVYHFGTEYAHQKCIDAFSPQSGDVADEAKLEELLADVVDTTRNDTEEGRYENPSILHRTAVEALRSFFKRAAKGGEGIPTEPGIYAWVPTDGSPALVLVNRRPSQHSPGGFLNGHCIKPTEFYDGAPVTSWGRDGKWKLLRPLQSALATTEKAGVCHD